MKIIHSKNKLLLIIFMVLAFSVSACKQTGQPPERITPENALQNITYSFKNPDTGQKFSIIHAYQLYENFFEAVQNQPDEQLFKLFQQEIITPVNESCFEDAKLMNSEDIFELVTKRSDFERVKNQIEKMNTDQLNEVFEESLVKSSNALPTDKETTVCIFPENENFPSDMGTIGAGQIVVYYEGFDKYFKSAMSHEYHHSVWLEKHLKDNKPLTGLDHLTLEGEAVMFETLMYPDLNSMYTLINESFNKEVWSKIEPSLERDAGPEILEIIMGGSNGIPNYYGYSEGYKIVRSYLDLHPEMTVEEWTAQEPKELFEEVNYLANYR
ncbi:DUF2268 domain-containing putative Zn-dependent protease [Sporosarcina jeotgali]|uniref:DUF2268 domain-containing putative Zn-dependent protease n=1 Tax=Sporosarcina jeotgali TaxID=3020056 RepID=A0ABZ0KUA0_9BACL|nr:DUF2268 domain-containing putative Zn-dependent protease [Sporosarcina sp. B2O-1]WOV83051.1 DUF2268 domain-containing putative Zn-dependent protease [Sporosarcina sp. B2O-1]